MNILIEFFHYYTKINEALEMVEKNKNLDLVFFELYEEFNDLFINYSSVNDSEFSFIEKKIFLIKQKLLFLKKYKTVYLDFLLKENNKLIEKFSFNYNYINPVKNVLDSKVSVSDSMVKKDFEIIYQQNFILNLEENGIHPIFINTKKLDFIQKQENKKLRLIFKEQVLVNKIELHFLKDIDEDIFISYKKEINGAIEYTTEKVSLSKEKIISVYFEECQEILIHSNSDFTPQLRSVFCHGGNGVSEEADCYGIIKLNEDIDNYLIYTDEVYDFFKININDFSNSSVSFLESDLDFNKKCKRLTSNELIENSLTTSDLIIFKLRSDKDEVNFFEIYNKG